MKRKNIHRTVENPKDSGVEPEFNNTMNRFKQLSFLRNLAMLERGEIKAFKVYNKFWKDNITFIFKEVGDYTGVTWFHDETTNEMIIYKTKTGIDDVASSLQKFGNALRETLHHSLPSFAEIIQNINNNLLR